MRFDELKANLLANGYYPLAVFDITGELDLFLRAYVEINLFITKITLTFEFARLKLFDFSADFTRPSYLGTESGGVLDPRRRAELEEPHPGRPRRHRRADLRVRLGGHVSLWSPQFGRDSGNTQDFDNVTSIVANFGAGDDFIDLSALDASGISVLIDGGDGNDTLIGPKSSACSVDTGFCASLFGDGGDDTLKNFERAERPRRRGAGNDTLYGSNGGNAGASTLRGGADNDDLHGGTGAETLDGGRGDDTIDGGGGADQYIGANAASIVTITTSGPGTGTLDLSGRTEALHIILKDGKILVGWGAVDNTAPGHPFIAGFDDYVHEIRVTDVSSITTILGGKGADQFTIYQTASAVMTLDGQGGNAPTTSALGGGASSPIHADVNDRGNPWDSGDQIVIDGSAAADTIVATDSQITGTGSQTVTYHRPDPDKNVLSQPRLHLQRSSRSASQPTGTMSAASARAARATCTYYYVVSAVDALGQESLPSDEILRPSVSMVPSSSAGAP